MEGNRYDTRNSSIRNRSKRARWSMAETTAREQGEGGLLDRGHDETLQGWLQSLRQASGNRARLLRQAYDVKPGIRLVAADWKGEQSATLSPGLAGAWRPGISGASTTGYVDGQPPAPIIAGELDGGRHDATVCCRPVAAWVRCTGWRFSPAARSTSPSALVNILAMSYNAPDGDNRHIPTIQPILVFLYPKEPAPCLTI